MVHVLEVSTKPQLKWEKTISVILLNAKSTTAFAGAKA